MDQQIVRRVTRRTATHNEDRCEHRRFRSRDLLALQRLQGKSLTIPEAYDCGHATSETTGHGMNRLVGAGLVFCAGWDSARDEGLWSLTSAGMRLVRFLRDQANATS